jgi:serine/threonine-protein kinase
MKPTNYTINIHTINIWRSLLTFASIGFLNLAATIPHAIASHLSPQLLAQNLENSSQTIAQSTQVPMKIEFGEGIYNIIVDDEDLSQPAYGGELNFFDVHVAKMFEITYDDCQRMLSEYGRDAGGRTWYYTAEKGNFEIGNVDIRCTMAYEVVETYGLGKPEPTDVKNFVEHQGVHTETRSIPVLDITGSKVSQWKEFVENFSSSINNNNS